MDLNDIVSRSILDVGNDKYTIINCGMELSVNFIIMVNIKVMILTIAHPLKKNPISFKVI